MGTIQHHQSRSELFLRRARAATDAALAAGQKSPADHNHALAEAAEYTSRAASHAVTALAVHDGFRHNTAHRLQIVIHHGIWLDLLRRGHLRTFRQTYTLPAILGLPHLGPISPKATATAGDSNGDGNRSASNAFADAGNRNAGNGAGARNRNAGNRNSGNVANAGNRNRNAGNSVAGVRNGNRNRNAGAASDADANPHPSYRPHHRRRPETAGHRPPITPIQAVRRMTRRVNALRKTIAAIIAGRAKPIRPAKRFRRVAPEDLPEITSKYATIRYAGEIFRLPNFKSVRRRYGLDGIALSTESDTLYRAPDGAAARRLCRCAPEPRHTQADHDHNVILIPEWRAALTQAYPHLKLPPIIPF